MSLVNELAHEPIHEPVLRADEPSLRVLGLGSFNLRASK